MLLAEMLQRFSISYQNSPARDSNSKVKNQILDFWTFLHKIPHKHKPSKSLALGFAVREASVLKNVTKSGKSPHCGWGLGQKKTSKSPKFEIWTF